MKQYYGNYLGLCINNNDPQKRGRVQVFIPHILPNLSEGWNELGQDLEVSIVGDNVPQSLPPEILEKLTKILPWCEAASPVAGTSSPGSLANNYFNQSPVAERSQTSDPNNRLLSTSTSSQLTNAAGLNRSLPINQYQSVARPEVGGGSSPGQPASGLPNSGLPQQGGMVLNPDGVGPSPMFNINNMASGMFSYPAAGSMLWVFFREGNPLFPVYFAANYGEKEWQSAYRYDSEKIPKDGEGYKPTPTEDNSTTSVGGTWNMGKVAAMHWLDRTDPQNPLNNEKSFLLGDHSGSNIAMTKNGMFLTSTTNRRDEVQLDRYEITQGNKEIFVQGNISENYFGQRVIRIGNTGPEAVAAAEEIAGYISQIMAPLAVPKTRGGGSGGSSMGSAGAPLGGGSESSIISSGGNNFLSQGNNRSRYTSSKEKPNLVKQFPETLRSVGENVLKNWGAPPELASQYGLVDGRITPIQTTETENPFVNSFTLRTLGNNVNFFYKTTGIPSRIPPVSDINVTQAPIQSFQTFLKPTKLNRVVQSTSGKTFNT
jgi:hypothetical protein